MLDNSINYQSLQLSMNEELFCALGFSNDAQNSSLS